MTNEIDYSTKVLESLVDLLDIPDSYYELAKSRYESLGEWFHRPDSTVIKYDPAIYPQGSFRLGTVIRPITWPEEYDLDLVCQLRLEKGRMSQKTLKETVGREVKEYALKYSFKESPEEKPRCWRLNYADSVNFHLDILPAIPVDADTRNAIVANGVHPRFTDLAVLITDRASISYELLNKDWPCSNPRGFALWFETKVRTVTSARINALIEKRLYASVDDVPTYAWKSPLQKAVQVLKRHRDVMFSEDPGGKPISMIITTLSAQAYHGEMDLMGAITNIIDGMLNGVGGAPPYIPNPVNPTEDFADKWRAKPQLRDNFYMWCGRIKEDISLLTSTQDQRQLKSQFSNKFKCDLSEAKLQELLPQGKADIGRTAPFVKIKTDQKPWS